jgi:ATP-dependent Lhr-like helicase
MPLSSFHPVVARWFAERLGEPTPAQRRGWAAIRAGADALIAAPTGSGKTLAAFLIELDQLLREDLAGTLTQETRVVYVSPLKALSADVHRNLAEPRREIRRLAEEMGFGAPRITAAVRSGDTPAAERAAMLEAPPHILVTTPESLYLLLTAERSRKMLRTVRTVIVDELHAVLESRRGAHLALSLERLAHVASGPVQRIGLSATVEPIGEAAAWLAGGQAGRRAGGQADRGATAEVGGPEGASVPATAREAGFAKAAGSAAPEGPLTSPELSPLPSAPARSRLPAVINEGHRRTLDLALELPKSPLEAVMAGEVWVELYDRLAELIRAHRTTLVFVNTRRLAERVARHLADRVGEDAVTAHHGSLAKETRLDAEERLKDGKLRALVATASLELGIDIGHVDLVCQLGTPRRISTFLQRVGRSGHTVIGTPKGRLFPLSRDELLECTALIRAVRRGELDRLILRDKPLDVLAQQIVAEVACDDWPVDDLFELVRGAYPYRALDRAEFDNVVEMLAQGFTTRRGRRAALIHHDGVSRRLRGRRGARLLAITSGGAIPDTADYRVVLEPQGTFLGTVNEDFAVESTAGDIFQLGNLSWRILRVQQGVVRVEDAHGQPPGLPFWLGEAPARSAELSRAVSDLRHELDARLDDREQTTTWVASLIAPTSTDGASEAAVERVAAGQLVSYVAESRRVLGTLPTQETIVAERFFDESGGMQLVIHAPFGSRVNRAWGLALRKRFCRQFNFELQAAATEDALLLSLGPQHSFPLDTVFRFLHPDTVRDILVQALLDAPMFGTRWRWNATIALAIPRNRGGRKVPPQLQRMEADDLLAAAFPDAAACLENIPGDREIPDHPLVRQTIDDCVHEAMDLEGLTAVLRRIGAGEIRCIARDLPEPSPLAHEILNARPYAFLDDAPLEERRTQAVYARRTLEPGSADDLGALDIAAIERVRTEAWPDPRNADELHDALLTSGFLTEGEGRAGGESGSWEPWLDELTAAGRAQALPIGATGLVVWVATERLAELAAMQPDALPPVSGTDAAPSRDVALRELLRGRLGILGPTAAVGLAGSLALTELEVQAALTALEAEGVVLRGHFTPGLSDSEAALEWCDRRLLARIHRYTITRLRAEIEPVSTADFMRFLFAWQRVDSEYHVAGLEGVAAVVDQLDGFELPAGAWEGDVLAARCEEYDPALLDTLCLTGRVAWGRLGGWADRRAGGQADGTTVARAAAGPIRTTPIALFMREHAEQWLPDRTLAEDAALSEYARRVREVLTQRGASFFHELVGESGLLPTQVEQALGELAALGAVTSDGFAGLRALITPSAKRKPLNGAARRHRTVPFGIESAGRWALLRGTAEPTSDAARRLDIEAHARTLLRRYGVVFRRLLEREGNAPLWRDLLLAYRRLEARGEIRGGRFVAGMAGEQFALPEAVGQLRATRRKPAAGQLVAVSAADPLNLAGIITPGERVPALSGNRVLYQDGVPALAFIGGQARPLTPSAVDRLDELTTALVRKRLGPALRARLALAGLPAAGSLPTRGPRRRRPDATLPPPAAVSSGNQN